MADSGEEINKEIPDVDVQHVVLVTRKYTRSVCHQFGSLCVFIFYIPFFKLNNFLMYFLVQCSLIYFFQLVKKEKSLYKRKYMHAFTSKYAVVQLNLK